MHINKYTIRNLSLDDCKSYLQFSRDIINEGEFILTHKDEFNYNIFEEKNGL